MPRKRVRIDFSRAPRRRKRSRRDIFRYWDTRFNAFMAAGFTELEAQWGANEGMSLRDPRVRDLMSHRRQLVAWFMQFYGCTREHAIELASEDLASKLARAGVVEPDLYYEVSL